MAVGEVVVERDHGVWVLTVRGEHDLTVAPSLRDRLEEVFARGSTVVVDLSQAEFVDSTVLAALVYGREQARAGGHSIALVLPPGGGPVRRLLELVRGTTLITTFASRAAAIDALTG
jgi:anti-anti-sigma factor